MSMPAASRLSLAGATAGVTLAVMLLACGEAWAAGLLTLLSQLPLLLLWLGACYGLGRWLVPGRSALAEVSAMAVGYGVLGTAVLLSELAGQTSWAGWVMVTAGVLLAAAHVGPRREQVAAWWRRSGGAAWFLPPTAGAAWGVMLAGALVLPGLLWGDEPAGYDVASYHMQLPREWHDTGRMFDLPGNTFDLFPLLVEMHYDLAFHLRGGRMKACILQNSRMPPV